MRSNQSSLGLAKNRDDERELSGFVGLVRGVCGGTAKNPWGLVVYVQRSAGYPVRGQALSRPSSEPPVAEGALPTTTTLSPHWATRLCTDSSAGGTGHSRHKLSPKHPMRQQHWFRLPMPSVSSRLRASDWVLSWEDL